LWTVCVCHSCFVPGVICFLDVLHNCNVCTVMPMFSLYWFYVLTLYVSVDLRADISVVHRYICLSVLPVEL